MKNRTKEELLIDALFWDYNFPYSSEGINQIYKYLLDKNEYCFAVEYRFACWLKAIMNYDLRITLPSIPEISDICLHDFYEKYIFNENRKLLFESFKKFIHSHVEFQDLEFQVLIGGSFTDIKISNPTDIDLIIEIPEEKYHNTPFFNNEKNNCGKIRAELKLDVKFLPIGYKMTNFKAYSNLICLGNNAKYKKDGDCFTHNNFIKRPVVRIQI